MITGKTLIELGFKPHKRFQQIVAHCNQHQLSGAALVDYVRSQIPVEVMPYERALSYHKNIRASSPQETVNVAKVFATMDELMKTPTLVHGAVMPDACPTGPVGQIPVGGIVAAKNAIHPAMHSADICCSVMMTNLGKVDPKKVLDNAQSVTHFGPGGRKDLFDLPEQIKKDMKNNPFLNNDKSVFLAKKHLGTQGDGNHFLYVGQLASTGETILVTHHGSRGLGAQLYRDGIRLAEKFRKEISPLTKPANAWIPYDCEDGKAYWDALQIIREWTKYNHGVLHDVTSRRIRIDPVGRFWNEHNFVFKDEDLFYHAKGATPLADKFVPDSSDGFRLIPLNMREPVLIVKGDTTTENLGFAPHGAGRNVSRTAHKKSKADRKIKAIFAEETKGIDVRFFSGHIDISELPSAYKDAQTVQRQMEEFNLGKVVDKILPYGCIMAGDWQKDAPWRKKNQARDERNARKKRNDKGKRGRKGRK